MTARSLIIADPALLAKTVFGFGSAGSFLNTDPRFIPWGDGTFGRVGWACGMQNTGDTPMYIDSFAARLKNR